MPRERSPTPQPQHWIKFLDPWMQDFYPVLGWGLAPVWGRTQLFPTPILDRNRFPKNFLTIKFALSDFYCRGVSHEKQRLGQFSSLPPLPAPPPSKQIFVVVAFPTKRSVWDNFPLCPHCPPPLKTANSIFIVVSPALILGKDGLAKNVF